MTIKSPAALPNRHEDRLTTIGMAEIREAIDNVLNLGDGSNRKLFALHASNAWDDSYCEDEAIEKRNFFDDPYPDDYDFPGYAGKTTNPFTEYLHMLAEYLEIPGIQVDEGFVSSSVLDGMPAYSVCRDELEKIAPLDSGAFIALRTADVRISDIPEDLRPDSATKHRQEWLENKVSQKTIQWLEERNSLQHTFLKELGLVNAVESSSNGDETTMSEGKEVIR